MECRGVVEKLEGDRALVRLLRSEKCDGCPGCGLFSGKPRNVVDLELGRLTDLQVGDEVTIIMPNRRLFFALVLVFGVPVLSMVIAYGVASLLLSLFSTGSRGHLAVLAAVIAGLLSFFLVSRSTNRPSLEPLVYARRGKGQSVDSENPTTCTIHHSVEYAGVRDRLEQDRDSERSNHSLYWPEGGARESGGSSRPNIKGFKG